jgi:hypothetical protein
VKNHLEHFHLPCCIRCGAVGGLLIAVAALAAGCPPAPSQNVQAYYGETGGASDVIAAVNANNERISTLWASGEFEADVHSDREHREKSDFVNGQVVVLYRSPREVLLVGQKDVAGRVFEIGCNSENYWMTVKGRTDTCWWGSFATIDKLDPKAIPIRPDLLLDVLGVGRVPTDMLQAPIPVMRFNNDADAYMFVWSARGPTSWLAMKEVWYDRQTFLPRLTNLFDGNGRVELSAYLSEPGRIAGAAGANPADQARMATRFRLFFPDSGTRLLLHLTTLKQSNNGIPNERSFRFNPEKTGAETVIRVDQGS